MGLIHSELIDTLTSILRLEEAYNQRSQVIDCMTGSQSEFKLASDRSLITPLIRYLQDMTQQMGLLCEPSEETRVGIALEEALLNGMYHGNLEVPSSLREEDEDQFHALIEQRTRESPYCDRRLQVWVEVTRDRAIFTIKDDGPGFDVTTVPDPTDPVNVERVFGRGMLLMRTFMDEVQYNETGNCVRLVKRRQVCDPS
jgi:anti-sigma regulatory factor (Ser/Thr protein kinase)